MRDLVKRRVRIRFEDIIALSPDTVRGRWS